MPRKTSFFVQKLFQWQPAKPSQLVLVPVTQPGTIFMQHSPRAQRNLLLLENLKTHFEEWMGLEVSPFSKGPEKLSRGLSVILVKTSKEPKPKPRRKVICCF